MTMARHLRPGADGLGARYRGAVPNPVAMAHAVQRGDTNVVFGFAFALALSARLLISGPLLDGFYRYSTSGGSLVTKIHPASWALYLLVLLSFLRAGPSSGPRWRLERRGRAAAAECRRNRPEIERG